MRKEKEPDTVLWREKVRVAWKGRWEWTSSQRPSPPTPTTVVLEADLHSARKNTGTLQWPLERKCPMGKPWQHQATREGFLCALWRQGDENCPISIFTHCVYVHFFWRRMSLSGSSWGKRKATGKITEKHTVLLLPSNQCNKKTQSRIKRL